LCRLLILYVAQSEGKQRKPGKKKDINIKEKKAEEKKDKSKRGNGKKRAKKKV
jgi:hypothetical protein